VKSYTSVAIQLSGFFDIYLSEHAHTFMNSKITNIPILLETYVYMTFDSMVQLIYKIHTKKGSQCRGMTSQYGVILTM